MERSRGEQSELVSILFFLRSALVCATERHQEKTEKFSDSARISVSYNGLQREIKWNLWHYN